MANGVYVLENILLCRNDDGNGKQYSVNGSEYKRRQCSMHTYIWNRIQQNTSINGLYLFTIPYMNSDPNKGSMFPVQCFTLGNMFYFYFMPWQCKPIVSICLFWMSTVIMQNYVLVSQHFLDMFSDRTCQVNCSAKKKSFVQTFAIRYSFETYYCLVRCSQCSSSHFRVCL